MKIENTFAADSADTPAQLSTILLVDDSAANLGVVVENLESHGYDVLVALDGEEALQRLEVVVPDLILLDVMMPGMNGFEVCEQLKAQNRTRDIPVIFMTSLSGTDDKVKGFAVGGVDYITKPLQVEEARARIKTHLELRALRQKLEAQNETLQLEVAERKRAEESLREHVEIISNLNDHLRMQAVELEASHELIKQTEAWYHGILHSAPDGMLVVNEQGDISLVNEHLQKMFGYTEEELLGHSMEKLLPLDVREGHVVKRDSFIASGAMARPMDGILNGLRACRKDGTEFPVDVSLSRLPDADGRTGVICAAIRDITERKRMEDALVAREQELSSLLENSPDNISRYDRNNRRIYANPTYGGMVDGGVAALLGKTPTEYPGGPNADIYEAKIEEVLATGVNAEFELNWPDKDDKEICSHVRLMAERDASGEVISVMTVGRDITELNEHRKRVYQMAFYDSLTSLPNRALFNDRLRHMLTDAFRHEHLVGVMLLDLDRFKTVNDTLGHPAGDELLREAAARLTYCVRGYDTVARLGGDEFAVLLPEIRSGDDLGRVANKILEAFGEPFLLDGREVFITCSVGIAVYTMDSDDGDDLLKQADSAMYFAKRSGRNNFRFYSKDLSVSANERLMLEGELRRGFGRGELALYFQPKINLADGALIGSEALLRWIHPERGLVPPDRFISIAEDCGLIVEIGEWVLRQGCMVACEWNASGKPLHKVAVNLSARQFQSNDLVRTVRKVLAETGCCPEWVELEITESLLLDEAGEVLVTLAEFREMGITIAIDDFGTGYSSLSYLARFPIDTLKIDRSFTSKVAESGHHAELVKAIISIAHSLHQKVVAEGVETPAQAAILQAYGCHIAQGYLYSKPIPKVAFEALPLMFS
jgi:diguanylate cyclase (GGDEF)-like protein/PAS domain S-box-containing protein